MTILIRSFMRFMEASYVSSWQVEASLIHYVWHAGVGLAVSPITDPNRW